MAREQLRRESIDLGDVPQQAWNECLDMLKRDEDPTTVYNTRWAEVLKEKHLETAHNRGLVKSLGGLHVVGTERHEARRIDNQLRGRSGRLGDPGTSRFYISLGDELMRRFGGERISGLMTRLGVEDDMPIEAGLVSKAIENAQTKVEGHNFDIRKHVLQYDEVVNEQRNRIYDQRRRILTEPSLKTSVEAMITEEINDLVGSFTSEAFEEQWQLDELVQALTPIFHLPQDFSVDQWEELNQEEISQQATQMALDAYHAKEVELGEEVMRRAEKQIMLWAVDSRWVRHLTDLDRLREGIGLQAFAQVDPLVAYKREAFSMYSELMTDIRSDIVKAVFTIQVQQPVASAPTPIARNIRTNRGDGAGSRKPQTVRKTGPELGRNDQCWCGSGKKYKNCHLQSDKAKASAGRVPAKPVTWLICISVPICPFPAVSATRWIAPLPSAAIRSRSSPRTTASGRDHRSMAKMSIAGAKRNLSRRSNAPSAMPAT